MHAWIAIIHVCVIIVIREAADDGEVILHNKGIVTAIATSSTRAIGIVSSLSYPYLRDIGASITFIQGFLYGWESITPGSTARICGCRVSFYKKDVAIWNAIILNNRHIYCTIGELWIWVVCL